MRLPRIALAAGLLPAALLLAACGEDSGSSSAEAISVTSSATACELSATSAPAGEVTFAVTNEGDESTEFYVYESDGESIVGEVEDIGPGLTRELSVDLEAGSYVTACKPGERGDGIRGDFTATA